MRERDFRNGVKELLSGKFRSMLPFVSQLLVKPRWLAGFIADGGLMKFPNVVVPGKGPMSVRRCHRRSGAVRRDLG